MAVCIDPTQRIVSNVGIQVQTLRIVQFRVRYRLFLCAPVRRHEPALSVIGEPDLVGAQAVIRVSQVL